MIIKQIEIPQNMQDFLASHDGATIEISYNSASANCGYAHNLHTVVQLKLLEKYCHRCGYSSIFRNELWERCNRHTYNEDYTCVFTYIADKAELTLEEAFNEWNKIQPSPKNYVKNYRDMSFGDFFGR